MTEDQTQGYPRDGYPAQTETAEQAVAEKATTGTTPAVDTPDDLSSNEGTEDSVSSADETPETFPADYVRQLRQEAAEARVKAKRADDLARSLFAARVAATGRLADPSDIAFDEALLEDPAALDQAIETLLSRKPHLAARVPRGDIGQGSSGAGATVDLADILRRNA